MKTKIRLWIPVTMLALSIVFLVTNCTKNDDVTKESQIPVLTTNEVTEVTHFTATSGGSITSDGGITVTERGVCWSTSQSPTIADNKTTDGIGAGSFKSAISGLTANTTYYVRAYATNSKGTGYGSTMSFITSVFNPNITYGSMTDIEGKTYKTLIIGTQTWMAENLKVTKYNDGTNIPNITDSTAWNQLTTGALRDYDHNSANSEIYGKLYNWYAVNTGKLCPTGWHVPSDAEWATLQNYLIANGYNYDGTTTGNKIAKAMASSSGWRSSSDPGTIGNNDYPEKQNASGFTALPGGYYQYLGFFDIGSNAFWWSSTEVEFTSDRVYHSLLSRDRHEFFKAYHYKEDGISVRCVRDEN